MRTGLQTTGWALVGFLALVVLLRLVHADESSMLLLGLTGATPELLVVAWPVAVGALAARQWPMAALAVVLVAVHLVVLQPLFLDGRGAGAAGSDLRILALNVEYDHDTGAAVSLQVRRADPDVVVLSELSDLTMEHLDLSQYPYSSTFLSDGGGNGSGIWSRLPLRSQGTRQLAGTPMSEVVLTLPDGSSLQVRQVHTRSPRSAQDRVLWKNELAALDSELQSSTIPTITAGDFNASQEMAPFAALLGGSRGIVDAADGRGLLPTWPSSKVVPPFLRLDHVLLTSEIGVRTVEVLGPTGSDHRAVVADLVVHA